MLPAMLDKLSGDEMLAALQEIQRLNAAGEEPIVLRDFSFWQQTGDAETVAAWAMNQPDGQYAGAVIAAWADSAPERARQWLSTLPATEKDRAVRSVIDRGLSPREGRRDFMPLPHFEGVAQWLSEIGDAQAREAATRVIAEKWLQMQPESGRAWLASAPLPQDVKNGLLSTKPAK